jgi:hypothetical protein
VSIINFYLGSTLWKKIPAGVHNSLDLPIQNPDQGLRFEDQKYNGAFYVFATLKIEPSNSPDSNHEIYQFHCNPTPPPTHKNFKCTKFSLMPIGVLTSRLCMLSSVSRSPMNISVNVCRMCLQSHLQTSPPTPQKLYLKFQNPSTSWVES